MVTRLFRDLEARLRHLVAQLPAQPAAPATFAPPVIHDAASIYAVMTHAACEAYMEDRCKEAADEALADYTTLNKLGRIAKHLCIFPFFKPTGDTKDLEKVAPLIGVPGCGIWMKPSVVTASQPEIKTALEKGHKLYLGQITKNHGMAYNYQFNLLALIGVDIGAFDPTFKSRVSTLAALRGEAAHRNVVAAQTIPPLSDLVNWTSDLIAGYKALDKELTRLRRVKA
ncbi:hypothetical protein NKI59_06550 [Mesorhizobium sp. M0598]|uniref:hypothetical protein n=1 Tax=Mesorhizobium sp. M0598 TaxID=2956968 RepID=UPI00333D2B6B